MVLTSSNVFAQAPPPAPRIYDLTAPAPQNMNPVVEVYETYVSLSGTVQTLVPPVGPQVTMTPTFNNSPAPPPAPPGTTTQSYKNHVGAVQVNNPTPNRYYWVKAYYYDNSGNGVRNYVPVTQTERP